MAGMVGSADTPSHHLGDTLEGPQIRPISGGQGAFQE